MRGAGLPYDVLVQCWSSVEVPRQWTGLLLLQAMLVHKLPAWSPGAPLKAPEYFNLLVRMLAKPEKSVYTNAAWYCGATTCPC